MKQINKQNKITSEQRKMKIMTLKINKGGKNRGRE
jgi:hypothetical protein